MASAPALFSRPTWRSERASEIEAGVSGVQPACLVSVLPAFGPRVEAFATASYVLYIQYSTFLLTYTYCVTHSRAYHYLPYTYCLIAPSSVTPYPISIGVAGGLSFCSSLREVGRSWLDRGFSIRHAIVPIIVRAITR